MLNRIINKRLPASTAVQGLLLGGKQCALFVSQMEFIHIELSSEANAIDVYSSKAKG